MISILGKLLALFLVIVGGLATLYVMYNTVMALIKDPIQIKDQDISQEDYLNRYKN